MIIVQVEGGLGNQMFQSALALSFIDRGIVAKLDISPYRQQHAHNGYELERVFAIRQQYCSAAEKNSMKLWSKLRHKMTGAPYKEKDEWQWHYHSAVNRLTSGYLKGYWQCEEYFAAASSLVRKKFSFPDLIDEKNKAILEKINNSNSVSLHIRRGDYLHTGIAASLHPEYYSAAIEYINTVISNPHYFVFSDDMEWATQTITEQRVEFIDWNKAAKSYIDMQLMSACKHNIIANSSFSWWGAWLNTNPAKTVVAPKQWMPQIKHSNIIPKNWVTIANQFNT